MALILLNSWRPRTRDAILIVPEEEAVLRLQATLMQVTYAYVSIRQHTSAYVSIRMPEEEAVLRLQATLMQVTHADVC
jgi:hypothetical protein